MKTYRYILAAAALLLGFSSCSKDDFTAQPEVTEPKEVDITVGAGFAETRTTMTEDGNVIWSATDKIKVNVNETAYDFELKSGEGTTSAIFHAVVSQEDADVLLGKTQGSVSAYYPTSGAVVPSTQTYEEGTFADEMNPMTATYANQTFTFTNNAAIVRVQEVSKDAEEAVLSYTVGETEYTVTMALTAGDTDKDLYFVVVPGAKYFYLSLDGGEAAICKASENTEAGKRYNIVIQVVQNTTTGEGYSSLAYAIDMASDGDVLKAMADFTETEQCHVYDKGITLDLNSKAISFTNGTAFRVEHNSGTAKLASLTIDDFSGDDPGEIFVTGSKFIYFGSNSAGTACVLNKGTITCNGTSNCTTFYCYYSGCNLTINGGKVVNERANYSGSPVIYLKQGTTATINGGEIVAKGSTYAEVVNGSYGTLNVNGGTMSSITTGTYPSSGGMAYCINFSNGTINISDGSISAYSTFMSAFALKGYTNTINITGGTFYADCADASNRQNLWIIYDSQKSCSVTGGTFKVGRSGSNKYTTGIDQYVPSTHQVNDMGVEGKVKTYTVTEK